MEKLVYVLFDAGDPAELRERLLHETAPLLLDRGARTLKLNVCDLTDQIGAPPGVAQPEGLAGSVSLWLDCLDDRGPLEAALDSAVERFAGYLVTESVVIDYAKERTWADGERTPGVLLLTLLEKPERLSYREWIDHWYGVQTPVSMMQPRWRYVRNAVVRPLAPGASPGPPDWQGIVEEGFPSVEDVTDPMRFYGAGSEEELGANISRMVESVKGFLDLDRVRGHYTSEYVLRS